MTKNFSFKGYCETEEFRKGIYYVELWGAEGGVCPNFRAAGFGGYSKGILNLKIKTMLTFCVGGQGKYGNSGIILGGFNGGGNAAFGSAAKCSSGGGGSSDIRICQFNSDRIIVAGGGGGGGEYNEIYQGGSGGGVNGSDGIGIRDFYGSGGSQSSGGKAGQYISTTGYPNCYAGDGKVLNGGNACSSVGASSGGGGGGYFGGGGGADLAGGGGGSGYVDSRYIYGITVNSTHQGDGLIKITNVTKLTKNYMKAMPEFIIFPFICFITLIK